MTTPDSPETRAARCVVTLHKSNEGHPEKIIADYIRAAEAEATRVERERVLRLFEQAMEPAGDGLYELSDVCDCVASGAEYLD